MFSYSGDLFEIKENEVVFNETCEKLKNHSFQSPWGLCFPLEEKISNNSDCKIEELNLSEKEMPNILSITHEETKFMSSNHANHSLTIENGDGDFKERLLSLKTSLLSVQDFHQTEYLKEIDVLSSLSLSQVSKFCESLYDAILTETSIALFLTAILNFRKPLGIAIAATIINRIVFPKILNLISSNCRNVSLAILNFSTVYPKAIIDELLIPCLKRDSLETPLLEVLTKVTKVNLPDEHVSYCIKNILNESLPTENTYLILQNLIERKITYENNLHNTLASTIGNWAPTNNRNIKFTKLLISILSTYGNQLTDQQMNIYSNAIKVNSTIMKKAAENVLKMLNP